jgi:hypothetical protein
MQGSQRTLFRSNTTPSEDHDSYRHFRILSSLLPPEISDEEEQQLQRHQKAQSVREISYENKDDDSSMMIRTGTSKAHNDDANIILLKIEAARQQLKQTRDFVHMLAAQMLLMTPEGEVVVPADDEVAITKQRRISNFLNLMSTFLHLTDYYIVGT